MLGSYYFISNVLFFIFLQILVFLLQLVILLLLYRSGFCSFPLGNASLKLNYFSDSASVKTKMFCSLGNTKLCLYFFQAKKAKNTNKVNSRSSGLFRSYSRVSVIFTDFILQLHEGRKPGNLPRFRTRLDLSAFSSSKPTVARI